MLKPTVKRSACDPCRAKRVRCLRAQDSMAPCARCCHIGTRCVTAASGQPGRPPKQRLANLKSTAVGPTDVSVPGTHHTPTLRDMGHVEAHALSMADMHTSVDTLHGFADPELAMTQSDVNLRPPTNSFVPESQPDFWAAPGDTSLFFGSPPMGQSPEFQPLFGKGLAHQLPHEDNFYQTDPLSYSPQLQGFFTADDELNTMLHMDVYTGTAVGVDISPLLDHGQTLLAPCFNATSSLLKFREEIDKHIATIDAYYSDPPKVLQQCKDNDRDQDVENPAALLLTCSKDFIDIVRSLTQWQTEDALSTEIVLLVLSSYLALLRLFESLFHRMYTFICQMPPASYKSMKVKSVLRIGAISSLQDMPLKAYATGILDTIKGQVQTLEQCMGVPAECCLSGVAAASSTVDRALLFWTVMAQEDVESQRGSKSYVESIRASIKDSMAFFDD
ncbi:hypothetical protein LTR97_011078 [Elasticomyces elasticus]|uniref:Zn(2)-C6 fungal-type domain-containing protein n=1 Tax=Elasticomyces elasticus TaxID=574655 RepID=A0AAN7VLK9_9PEZI|nr:hypothetical protein LTR97_011078 [Elasticomyces elasticus]